MDSLPVELVVSILSYLQPEDVRRFQRINSRFGGIIKRHENSRKIPVDIIFFGGRGFQTYMHISCVNIRRSVTIIVNSECGEISVENTDSLMYIYTMLNPCYKTFLEKMLSVVEILKLYEQKAAICDSKVLCEFGRIVMEKNCSIQEIDFTRSALNVATIEFLRIIKKSNGTPTLLLKGEPSALVDHDIVNWSSFFKTIYVIRNVDTFPEFLGHIIGYFLNLDKNMIIPGIAEVRNCNICELKRTERWIRQFFNSHGPIQGRDGRTLKFEISIVDNAKLVVTYCYEK